MFTIENEGRSATKTEDDQARQAYRMRETALEHAVKLAIARVGYHTQGIKAETLLEYAQKLENYLKDGTVPTLTT